MYEDLLSRNQVDTDIKTSLLKAFLFFASVIVSTLSWSILNKNDQINVLRNNSEITIAAENTDLKDSFSVFASEAFSQAIFNNSELNIAFTYPRESVRSSLGSSFVHLQFLENQLFDSYLSKITIPTASGDESILTRNYWSAFFSKTGIINEIGPTQGSIISSFTMNMSANIFSIPDSHLLQKVHIFSIKKLGKIFSIAVVTPEIISLNDRLISDIQSILETSQEEEIPSFTSETIPNINKFNKYELATQLATVKLYSHQCITIAVDMHDLLPETSKKTYKTCIPLNGTGFFIGSTGTILTNAQFVAPNPYDTLLKAIQAKNDSGLTKAIAADVVVAMNKKEPYLNTGNSEVQREIIDNTNKLLLYGLSQFRIKPSIESSTFYIQQSTPFSYNENGTLKNEELSTKGEKVVSNESKSLYEYAFTQAKNKQDGKTIEPFLLTQPDIALLKIPLLSPPPGLSLTLLPVLGVGSSVSVIGFQGSQSSQIAQVKNTTLSEKVLLTSGFLLYRITTSLDSSLIGGPIITKNGDFKGISTYTIEGNSKTYNGILSNDVVQNFLKENNVSDEKNSTLATFSNALNNITMGYYSWAKNDLALVSQIYPTASIFTTPLEKYASEQINAGNDNTPIYSLLGIHIHRSDLPVIAVGATSLLIITIIAIILQKKNMTTPSQPQRPMKEKRRPTALVNPYYPNFVK